MKALTICQPYAHLIAIGEKWVENRKWSTTYRGPLAIHAGKSKEFLTYQHMQRHPSMEFGSVVAIADLTACVHITKAFGYLLEHEHTEGPWCWVLKNVRRIDPVRMSGAQGLWEWNVENEAMVKS